MTLLSLFSLEQISHISPSHKFPQIEQCFMLVYASFIVESIFSISISFFSSMSKAILMALFLPIPGSFPKTSISSSNFFIISPFIVFSINKEELHSLASSLYLFLYLFLFSLRVIILQFFQF